MTEEVISLNSESSLEDVTQKMFVNNVHTLPVIDDGKLVGVVGKHDLIMACF